jgi:uncharacterized phage-associated protein
MIGLNTTQHQFNRQKLLDAILYVCRRQDPSALGRVKLHKILYFADMLHFLDTGRPLTGVEYIKQQFGPTARHLTWALNELQRQGRLTVSEREFFGTPKTDFFALTDVDTNALSDDERSLLSEVADFVCAKTAKEISELSHTLAWESVNYGDVIPYESALMLVPAEVTDEDVEWARDEAKNLGLVP